MEEEMNSSQIAHALMDAGEHPILEQRTQYAEEILRRMTVWGGMLNHNEVVDLLTSEIVSMEPGPEAVCTKFDAIKLSLNRYGGVKQ